MIHEEHECRAVRERDSLARRLNVRWGELEEVRAALQQMTADRNRWRAEAEALTDQLGDMRATVSTAEAEVDYLRAAYAERRIVPRRVPAAAARTLPEETTNG